MGISFRGRGAALGGVVILVLVVVTAVVGTNLMQQPAASPSTTPLATAPVATVAAATPGPSVASPSATSSVIPSPSVAPTPSGFADLDGMPAPPDIAHRLPLAVMIDDNKHARPQSGMNAASIVYQAPADGGEVRYMVVFQEGDSKDVGPVRSVRPYFAKWAVEYRPLLAHYGGDHESLSEILPSLQALFYNMDGIYHGSCPYHRISGKPAPYNAYTSTAALRRCAASKGYPSEIVTGTRLRTFTDDLQVTQRPASATIKIPYVHQTVGYTFDRTSNAYLRWVDGKPQTDAADGGRVTARNIVVLFQSLSVDSKSEPGYVRPVVGNIGSGRALVFHDGLVFDGIWRKSSAADLTRVFDSSGKEIPLVRGRIFIQVVATGTKVAYS